MPQRWMIPPGGVLASGTVGLLLGFALGAHARVHDRQIAGAVMFLALIVVALAADLAYRNHW
jgi:hypothetical protein